MIQQGSLVHRSGVVVQASGNGQIHGKVLFRHTESTQVHGNCLQLLQALVKNLVAVLIALQGSQNLVIGAGDGNEAQDFLRLLLGQTAVLQQNDLDLFRPNLIQLVHGAHNVSGLLRQTQHGIEAGENLPVVHPDLEPAQAEAPENLVDNGRDLCLVEDIQLAITDDVNICLIELPEAAPLGPLTPVDLADLEPAEGESQLIVVQCHILCQRHRQVKPQCQVAVALGEAVDLLFRLAAALGQQNLGILNGRGVQRGKAVGGVGGAQDFQHFFKADLLGRQQLHKAGQSPGLDNFHIFFLSKALSLRFLGPQ